MYASLSESFSTVFASDGEIVKKTKAHTINDLRSIIRPPPIEILLLGTTTSHAIGSVQESHRKLQNFLYI
jgi:hypothetical protein